MEQKASSCPVNVQCVSMVVEGALLSTAPHLVIWGPRIPPSGGLWTLGCWNSLGDPLQLPE